MVRVRVRVRVSSPTSPRRTLFGPSNLGSRSSRRTFCNRPGRTCTCCTWSVGRVRDYGSAGSCARPPTRSTLEHRREQPSPSPLPAGDREDSMLALTTYSLYDWDKRSVPAEAACATRVQVVAGRAAFAEPLRTSIVVTPRGAVGFRGHGHADRASAAVSRVVNARVCRKHTHASGQEQWAWQREAKAGSESGAQCPHWLHQSSHTASATPAATAMSSKGTNRMCEETNVGGQGVKKECTKSLENPGMPGVFFPLQV